MGIIIRQSIKSSIVNFTGALIGMVSVLFIYPLERETVGFAYNFYSLALLFIPFIMMGNNFVAVKYYYEYKTDKETSPDSFLWFIIIWTSITFVLFSLGIFIFEDRVSLFLTKLNFNPKIFTDHAFINLSLAYLMSMIAIFTSFSGIFGRTTIPTMITNFGYKLYLPIVILLIHVNLFSTNQTPIFIWFFNFCAVIILGIYLKQWQVFTFKWDKIKYYFSKIKSLYQFSVMNGLSYVGSVFAFRIDSIMVSGMLGYASNGLYVLPATMASVLDIPNQAIQNISTPIISKAWKENNFKMIESIYKKASINLLIIGLLILIGGVVCYDNLIALSKNLQPYSATKYVFLFLCLAKIFDMLTSINGPIIGYSDHFRVNLYFVLFLGVMNISLNFYLIPKYGLVGTALATFFSLSLYNIFKLIFIYRKFDIHPFTKNTFTLLLIALLSFVVGLLLPNTSIHPIVDIIFKGGIIVVLFLGLVLRYKISEDFSEQFHKFKGMVWK